MTKQAYSIKLVKIILLLLFNIDDQIPMEWLSLKLFSLIPLSIALMAAGSSAFAGSTLERVESKKELTGVQEQ